LDSKKAKRKRRRPINPRKTDPILSELDAIHRKWLKKLADKKDENKKE
jgi:hypothetical protein